VEVAPPQLSTARKQMYVKISCIFIYVGSPFHRRYAVRREGYKGDLTKVGQEPVPSLDIYVHPLSNLRQEPHFSFYLLSDEGFECFAAYQLGGVRLLEN
jgi:hypothetical protein